VPPAVQLLDMASDANSIDLSKPAHLAPDIVRLHIRYAAIHLSAPERVRYSYKLTGLEPGWVSAGARREINYNSLKHGHYVFSVNAQIPGGPSTEQSYAFDVLPHYYETVWFRLFCVAILVAGHACSESADADRAVGIEAEDFVEGIDHGGRSRDDRTADDGHLALVNVAAPNGEATVDDSGDAEDEAKHHDDGETVADAGFQVGGTEGGALGEGGNGVECEQGRNGEERTVTVQ
jgi:hypothetical protein